jgi:hypothetical protein
MHPVFVVSHIDNGAINDGTKLQALRSNKILSPYLRQYCNKADIRNQAEALAALVRANFFLAVMLK